MLENSMCSIVLPVQHVGGKHVQYDIARLKRWEQHVRNVLPPG